MITRRRIICSILSALVFLAVRCSAPSIAASACGAGQSARRRPLQRAQSAAGTEEARGLVEAASDYYEREFDIRTDHPKRCRLAGKRESAVHANLAGALTETNFPVAAADGSYDILVAFTGENASRYSQRRTAARRSHRQLQPRLGALHRRADTETVSLHRADHGSRLRRHRLDPRARPCLRRRTCRGLQLDHARKLRLPHRIRRQEPRTSSEKTAPARLPNNPRGDSPVQRDRGTIGTYETFGTSAKAFKAFKSFQSFQAIVPC